MLIQSLSDMQAIYPELFLAVASLVMLLVGVTVGERATRGLVLGAVVSFAVAIVLLAQQESGQVMHFSSMFVTNDFTVFGKKLVLLAASIVLALTMPWLSRSEHNRFEYPILVMLSVTGMMLMISAADLLAVYMGLELSSLALYVLAASNRDDEKSTEAGLKYFVLGALSSGMMLFGISLVYGFTGTINFEGIAQLGSTLASHESGTPAQFPYGIAFGLVLVLAGFCFKISAVPFHMWTPDVYEGAPTPVTALFATAPKIAMLFLMARVLSGPMLPLAMYWQQVLVFSAVASMLVGAFAALVQTNIKRLLAYSSIGHMGYALVGLVAGGEAGYQAVVIYVALYLFMSAGAFGCVLYMQRNGEYVEKLSDLAGIAQRHPLLAMALSAFMLSMAGIPPLAGFFGKMYIFVSAVQAGMIVLAVIGVLSSVVSCYYYLKVIKIMYFDEGENIYDTQPMVLRATIAMCFVVTVFFVLHPAFITTPASIAVKALM
jgi:NADH-quinone oxidoreductase subunit N